MPRWKIDVLCNWTTFRDWAARTTGWELSETTNRTGPGFRGILPTITEGIADSPGQGVHIDYTPPIRRRFLAIIRWRRHALDTITEQGSAGKTDRRFIDVVDDHPEGGWYLRGHDQHGWAGTDAEAEAFIRQALTTPYGFAVIPVPDDDDVALDT